MPRPRRGPGRDEIAHAGRTAQLFAVPVETLRAISAPDDVRPGEVVVRGMRQPTRAVKAFMPKPKPSDLAFEVWRLRKTRRLTFGQIATTSPIARFLSPNSQSSSPEKVRNAEAKRHYRDVEAFLKTPIGRTISQTFAFRAWRKSGRDLTRLRLLELSGHEEIARARIKHRLIG